MIRLGTCYLSRVLATRMCGIIALTCVLLFLSAQVHAKVLHSDGIYALLILHVTIII